MEEQKGQEIRLDIDEIGQRLSYSIYIAAKMIIMKCLKWVCIVTIIQLLVHYALGTFDADSTDGDTPSGMGLHTDAQTGCQYLSTASGGIISRTDNQGKHVGCKNFNQGG